MEKHTTKRMFPTFNIDCQSNTACVALFDTRATVGYTSAVKNGAPCHKASLEFVGFQSSTDFI